MNTERFTDRDRMDDWMKTGWIEGPPTETGPHRLQWPLGGTSLIELDDRDDLNRYQDVIRHFKIPDPPPQPKPLKPFRRFNCICGTDLGTGAFDPNGDTEYPYQIHWCDSDLKTRIRNEQDFECRSIKLEWIDDA